jgi:hypothetical protein
MKILATVLSQSGREYQIWYSFNHLQCSCPHYQYRLRKSAQECKHIKEARPQLAALLGIETKKQMERYSGPGIFIQMEGEE